MRDEVPRQLIVTADDMGLYAPWDEAIARAHDRGIVTSTSIATTGQTFGNAVRILQNEGLDHGVHLDLLDGTPLSSAAEIPSLVDDRGRFRSLRALLVRFASGRVRPAEVEREWSRQIARAIGEGLRPTHLNGHFHLHVLPGIFRVAVRLATRFGIRWIRMPDEPPWFALRASGGTPRRIARTAILCMLSWAQRGSAKMSALRHADCREGATCVRAWPGTLQDIHGELTEIFCHPGQSASETAALMSSEVRRAIDERFRRTSFRDIHGVS
ncbi:MAG TPA: ChbG/HpnK family deacetylase [Polyangiaceae bacterium]|jgi:predicted glycoside hydrolase/deacetylase ChbG (UPF0249 family)